MLSTSTVILLGLTATMSFSPALKTQPSPYLHLITSHALFLRIVVISLYAVVDNMAGSLLYIKSD